MILIEDRYQSEQVEDDAYFLDILRYICQNPAKDNLCEKPFEHPRLGYSGIAEGDALLDDLGGLTDREAIERLRIARGYNNAQDIGGWMGKKCKTAVTFQSWVHL